VSGPSGRRVVAPWRRLGASRLQSCRVFDLDRVRFAPPDGRDEREFYVVEAPDWINVVPLTEDQRVVFVRQFRFGANALTLEIPGGMCDEGELPRVSALRELREETGYETADLVDLGWVHPNPAIQSFYDFFVYPRPGIILAQFLVGTALAIRSIRAAFDAADRRVEAVALTLGCSRFGAFWRAALPQTWSGMLAGGVVCWSYSVGLFAPVAIFAGTVKGRTAVLPTRTYLEVSVGHLELALALTLVMAAIAMTVLVALKVAVRRPAAGGFGP